jgi:hypothetical protein
MKMADRAFFVSLLVQEAALSSGFLFTKSISFGAVIMPH